MPTVRNTNCNREKLIAKSGGPFETHDPDADKCCICAHVKPIVHVDRRPTGINRRQFSYSFCASCWVDFQEQCCGPMEYPQLIRMARLVWPETFEMGEMGFGEIR